jgi:hypothetical protein
VEKQVVLEPSFPTDCHHHSGRATNKFIAEIAMAFRRNFPCQSRQLRGCHFMIDRAEVCCSNKISSLHRSSTTAQKLTCYGFWPHFHNGNTSVTPKLLFCKYGFIMLVRGNETVFYPHCTYQSHRLHQQQSTTGASQTRYRVFHLCC